MKTTIIVAFVAFVVAACGNAAAPEGGSGAGSGTGSGSGSGSVASAWTPPPPADAGTGSAGSAGSGSAASNVKLAAARCDEPCLFLGDTPLAKLDDAYTAACPGKPAPKLGGDCGKLDYLRNCIYAAHGLVYKHGKWKTTFASKPWYTPDPNVTAKTALGTLELANVHALRARAKTCKKDIDIKTADYDRVAAWFHTWPKRPPLPAVTFIDGGSVDAKVFAAKLQSSLGKGAIELGPKVQAIYMGDDLHYTGADWPSDDMPDAMVTAIKAPDEKKLRAIRVAFPDAKQASKDEWTGTHVFFIYDDHDKLLGVEVRPFAYGDLVEDL